LLAVREDAVGFLFVARDFPFTLSAIVVVASPKPFGVASREEVSSLIALLPPAVMALFVDGIFFDAASIVVDEVAVAVAVVDWEAVAEDDGISGVVVRAVAAALALLSANISNAKTLVSPEDLAAADFTAFLPFLLYMRESAAQKSLFQASASSPAGRGSASLYLYLN